MLLVPFDNLWASYSFLLQKLAKFGDGYKHNHADPKHPFTEMESFEGVNIRDTVMVSNLFTSIVFFLLPFCPLVFQNSLSSALFVL